MVNRVILIGNLGRDPEVRRLENGAVVAKFSIATNENYRDKSGEWQSLTEWHDIVMWRSLAERAEGQLKKGMPVYVEGKLTHRTWEDQDGNKRKTTEVVANYFRSLASRRDGEGNNSYFPSADDEYPGGGFSSSSVESDNSSSEAPVSSDAADDDLPF
ncbi:single-stranded DNA-binding protein [Flavilitoribacter nigricans]|uniref:Single-stranded DNA-binding protein n=1 Tax=Flavilitoribacter nigricans (strain ATCC 23147 / DSM 23189 / NBRC 102662 / NCIMB 1420 / SS-2) TaxID=1122177 RepID=A0A2D0N3J7_FLAN2|nr:single-stranded DNA-binding protein [Flavilitoribacter nigricans]PHN03075.1 single-stranded DNA-binding protein [Flavilitoribacter nigricans DSM 23189 = NBRC 102662]